MNRRTLITLCLFPVVLLAGVITYGVAPKRRVTPQQRVRLRAVRNAAAWIKPLHEKKKPARQGDWLDRHQESGQTFEEYWVTNPNRPTRGRGVFYIQPLGEFSKTQEKLVDQTVEMMGLFFASPVKKLPALPLSVIPEKARRTHPTWGDKQLLTTRILYDVLQPRRPQDAVAVLALTTSDLWPGKGWNFVFGQADLRRRVGVWSLYRNGDPDSSREDYLLCLRRTLKTATHETGHMLGIAHCVLYECGMNGSNHRKESDRQPLWLCPECAAKVWWSCGADPAGRYHNLAEFAEKNSLEQAAKFWRSCRERFPQVGKK